MVKVQNDVLLAALSLLIGSMATPILYVAGAWLFPQGFADLRQASMQTVFYYFAFIWVASALMTGLIGASTWRFLHRRGWDGFAAYVLLAAVAAALASLVSGAGLKDWEAVVMAIGNGLTVRIVERTLR